MSFTTLHHFAVEKKKKNVILSLQSSADAKKRYGIDTKNERYKPGGGNVQVFSQKIDMRSVTPRTDTSKPKAVLSPRASPAKGILVIKLTSKCFLPGHFFFWSKAFLPFSIYEQLEA